MTTRFQDLRLQANYKTALANHAKCMSAGNGAFSAYRRGYQHPDRPNFAPARGSVAYVYWAAGRAESNQGVDWKALSHAVRVARQAIELLRTGEVIFPRPEAAHLRAIKLGELPYAQVAEEIDDLLPAVEREAALSTLPETADIAWIDDFVAEVYGCTVRNARCPSP